jgi:glycosyltransferase involved in cell wall biosynthesis
MNEPVHKLKILQVNTTDRGGGAASSAWHLFREYKKRGHVSWLAVGYKFSDDPDVYRIPLNKANGLIHRMSETVRRWLEGYCGKVKGAGRLRAILPLMTSLEKMKNRWHGMENCYGYNSDSLLTLTPEQPNVIHCHNLHGGYFDLQSLIYLSREVPVILNLRDCWLLTGHCAHPLNCERWLSGCGDCPDLSIYPRIRYDATQVNWKKKRDIYHQSQLYIVANSQWMLNQARKSGLVGMDYCVIENGIDLSVFKPGNRVEARADVGLPTTAKVIMFAANGVRKNLWKDYRTMEDAIVYLAKYYKSGKLIFLFVGEQSKDKKIGDNIIVKFLGFLQDTYLMTKYYRCADVYMHAAKAESSCRTVTEALACGIPVVATAIGGIPEQIEDGINGFLTRPSDPQDMAYRTQMILENDDIRTRMSKEAVRSSLRFDLNRQVDEFLALYNAVKKNRREVVCNF